MEEGLTAVKGRPVPRAGKSRIIFNRPVGPGWYVLRLAEPSIAAAAEPGRFVQIQTGSPGSFDPLLRRPFSVYWADPGEGTYDILYTALGRGTRWLAALPREPARGQVQELDVIGPFGNAFSPPVPGDRCFLVGGGVGVAPLYFLARKLTALPERPEVTLCMGARTESLLQGLEGFRGLPIRIEVSTDDGSAGRKGLVTDLLGDLLAAPPRQTGGTPGTLRVYACGPPGMNEALRRIVVERGIWCEICLEARMACGFGICFGCVAPIRKELGGPAYNRRVCWEGPVFDARLILEVPPH